MSTSEHLTAYGTVVWYVVPYEYMFMLIVKLNRRCRTAPHKKVPVPHVHRQMITELDSMILAK